MAWHVLDSYGCSLNRFARLRDALAWTVPADHTGTRPCTICTTTNLGDGVYEVRTCDGLYTVTRHAPEYPDLPTPRPCTGNLLCTAEVHIHGCHADHGACDSPDEHKVTSGHIGRHSQGDPS